MQSILTDYPWMIWIIVLGIIAMIGIAIVLFLLIKNDDSNEFESSNRAQEKVIKQVFKEDKKNKDKKEVI